MLASSVHADITILCFSVRARNPLLSSSGKTLKQRESKMFITSRAEAGRPTHGEIRFCFYDFCRILPGVASTVTMPACPKAPSPVTPKVAILPVPCASLRALRTDGRFACTNI